MDELKCKQVAQGNNRIPENNHCSQRYGFQGHDLPHVVSNFDPMGMIDRIYVGTTKQCYILNKQALGLVVSEKEICLCFSFYKPLPDDAPGAWPFWTPGEWLAGSIKEMTKHCYTQYIAWYQRIFMFFIL